jgi:hypothetical protein
MRKSNETAALIGVLITALLLVPTAILSDNLILTATAGYMKLDTKGPYEYEEMSGTNIYNYPNLYSGRTAIRFALPESRAVDIVVSDVAGRPMWQKHLLPNETIPGINYVLWEGIDDRGTQLANGTYILRVMSDGKIVVKKISIVR